VNRLPYGSGLPLQERYPDLGRISDQDAEGSYPVLANPLSPTGDSLGGQGRNIAPRISLIDCIRPHYTGRLGIDKEEAWREPFAFLEEKCYTFRGFSPNLPIGLL
jgi:hypothetical protein